MVDGIYIKINNQLKTIPSLRENEILSQFYSTELKHEN